MKKSSKRVLIVSQFFYPEDTNAGSHITDLAIELINNDVNVDVISSAFKHEDNSIRFSSKEKYKGINISRIRHTGFGKASVVGRILDILSFNLILILKLIFIKRKSYDHILGLTNPPLVSFIAVTIARMKKIPFIYWSMDLQPELSIAHGLISPNNLIAKLMLSMNKIICRKSNKIIALDKYMKNYLGTIANPNKINIIPMWTSTESRSLLNRNKNEFLIREKLLDKFVIMYSGNHCLVHPLETVIKAAKLLQGHPIFQFVFIGEGVQKNEIKKFKEEHKLDNITCLPYEPRDKMHISLSAADVQIVTMGSNTVNYTHPCKIYSNMVMSKPILFIGPDPSHVSDLIKQVDGNLILNHGQSELLANNLIELSKLSKEQLIQIGNNNNKLIQDNYSKKELLSRIYKTFYSS